MVDNVWTIMATLIFEIKIVHDLVHPSCCNTLVVATAKCLKKLQTIFFVRTWPNLHQL